MADTHVAHGGRGIFAQRAPSDVGEQRRDDPSLRVMVRRLHCPESAMSTGGGRSMTKKRSGVGSGSRGLMSLLALSCMFVWSCAADMTAGVADEDQDGMVTDSPVDETGILPGDEETPAGDEVADET